MTSNEFMGKLWELAYDHLKKAGITIFIMGIVVWVLYDRMERQEVKFEAAQKEQKEDFRRELATVQAESANTQKGLNECIVERTLLKAKVDNLERMVMRFNKQ